MPGPHRKMVTQEESATLGEGEGEAVAREKRVDLRGATVGQDIEEAQELPVDPARGGHCAWEEGVGSAIPVGVPVPVTLHLFACLVLQEPVGVMIA